MNLNITQYAADLTAQMSHISPSSIPPKLWDYYVRYLWYYQPSSIVARIAYTFRLLALLLIMPAVILILLDISAYLLARTLGVVDDVKASTSDKGSVHFPHETHQPPTITVQAPLETSLSGPVINDTENESRPPVFYASGDDQSNLQLSGVGVFSPAGSAPPSPKTTQWRGMDQLRQRHQHQIETES